MNAKLSNFSELSNILSVKSSLRTNLMSLFTRFGLGHLFCIGLGACAGRDFDEQIADCTLCFLTYITMALEKRFSEYETMGGLFENMEEDLMALTLWKRVLSCIKRFLEVLCEHLGVTIDELEESLINDDEAASAYLIMTKALEDREQTKKAA